MRLDRVPRYARQYAFGCTLGAFAVGFFKCSSHFVSSGMDGWRVVESLKQISIYVQIFAVCITSLCEYSVVFGFVASNSTWQIECVVKLLNIVDIYGRAVYRLYGFALHSYRMPPKRSPDVCLMCVCVCYSPLCYCRFRFFPSLSYQQQHAKRAQHTPENTLWICCDNDNSTTQNDTFVTGDG